MFRKYIGILTGNDFLLPMIAEKISHYRIIEKIGSGGLGVVYRAYDATTGREVAIKTLPSWLGSQPEALERFQREAKLAAAILDPHVVSIYDFGVSEGIPFLVTEYVKGESLAAKILRGRLPIYQAVHIGRQVAQALVAAHKSGIIHRDVKPANIMITSEGDTKLVDFGLADLTQRSTSDSTVKVNESAPVGTIPYMSPEQFEGVSAGERTDIYSLGAVLYEMATGKRPFKGPGETTVAELINGILHKRPASPRTLNPQVPKSFEAIILKSLEKNPKRRFSSMVEVVDALGQIEGRDRSGQWGFSADWSPPVIAAPFTQTGYKSAARRKIQGFPRTFAKTMLALTATMIAVGLIPLGGTVLGFGMAFGSSLLCYECYLLLKA